jgi:hypothetical protein
VVAGSPSRAAPRRATRAAPGATGPAGSWTSTTSAASTTTSGEPSGRFPELRHRPVRVPGRERLHRRGQPLGHPVQQLRRHLLRPGTPAAVGSRWCVSGQRGPCRSLRLGERASRAAGRASRRTAQIRHRAADGEPSRQPEDLCPHTRPRSRSRPPVASTYGLAGPPGQAQPYMRRMLYAIICSIACASNMTRCSPSMSSTSPYPVGSRSSTSAPVTENQRESPA